MNKPTLVLLPGLLCDRLVWENQLPALQKYAHVHIPEVLYDNRVDKMIENILAKCPPVFCLAGHSMGGWIALELMRKHHYRIEKLCILATSSSLDSAEKQHLRREGLKLYQSTSAQSLAKRFTALYVSTESEIFNSVYKMFERNMDAFIPQQEAMIHRASCESLLPTIQVPTTVIVGERDTEFYHSTQYIAEHIPHAHFVSIPDCGHMLTMEQPELCTQAMVAWLVDNTTN